MYSLFTTALPRCSLTPRDYQQRAIDNAFELWNAGTIGVLCRLPTGAGKTLTGTLIADRWLQQGDDYRVLVLAHERQLIDQFAQEIEDILRVRPAIEMASDHCKGTEKIIVGSRQSLQSKKNSDRLTSRLYKFRPDLNWLLICDESHRWTSSMKSCKEIIEWFEQNPNHRRLGLTATPERTDKLLFTTLFPGVASDYRLHDVDGGPCAVNDGWAVPYDQRYITVEGVDFTNIKEAKRDFDPKELERILGEQSELAKLCDPMLDIAGRRRTLIFSPTTAMAKNVALYLNAKLAHTAARSLDGNDPDQTRKNIYRQHQEGQFQFLSVCGLCREGYNDPDIQAVAIFRPTKSRSLAEQMKGRGCRPMRGTVSPEMSPDERRRAISESAKPSCMIIDLVGATGLGDVPSTVDIIADGKPDEVIERAKKKLLSLAQDEPGDVQKAIRHAEDEIIEERRLAREARLQRDQEVADRRARLKVEVKYESRKVNSGQAGKDHRRKKHKNPPSEGMCRLLSMLGVDAPRSLSMSEGKRELNVRTAGHGENYIVRGGVHRGKRLCDLEIPQLKALIAERNTSSKYDLEFQSEVDLFREQYRAKLKAQRSGQ